LRDRPRPLRDLCAIDRMKVELVQLHGKPRFRTDRVRESVSGRHAVFGLGDHGDVVALSLERVQDAGEERATKTRAAMLGLDGDLGPPDVSVLGVFQISRRDAVAGEPAAAVSRYEDRAPLPGRPGA